MKKYLLSAFSLSALLVGSQAIAATATTTFTSKVIVTAACAVTATNIDFGTTGLFTANIDMTSTINVTCTTTTPYVVGIGIGTYGTAVAARKMKTAAAAIPTVAYSLFRDTARTANWGLTAGTDTVAGVGTGLVQPLTVYGRVPVQAAVAPGTYTDTLSVTLTY
jgi:spore coat protein U-like protein